MGNTKGSATVFDVRLGITLRTARQLKGWSQEALASKMGITFQQLQKYEKGSNRVACGRLNDICKILELPSSHFIEGSRKNTRVKDS